MKSAARLNVFQRLIRQWDVLHPYNAGQMMKLAGRTDICAIEQVWCQTLRELGLGPVNVRERDFWFVPLNGQVAPQVTIVAEHSLDDFISRELNRPFSLGDVPFRPFCIARESDHVLGVIYQHWVADSASIRLIMREWFVRLFDPGKARRLPVRLAQGGYWRFCNPGRAGWQVIPTILAGVNFSSRMKRMRRVQSRDSDDLSMRFSLHEAPPGVIGRVATAARVFGVTVNDLFLAAIAQTCLEHGPNVSTRRRTDLALGTIVDLRGIAASALRDDFGIFLGYTNVVLRPGDVGDPRRLIERIAAQNRQQKDRAAPHGSVVQIAAALAIGSMLGPNRIKDFYRKRFPLGGGISNVNMNRTWAREYHPSPLIDYVRISPTGPMMPLVFTPTTLGDRLSFGLTCRASIIPEDRARKIASAFVERLDILAKT